MQHVFFDGAKVRVLKESGLGAIRLERISASFFILSVPEGAPHDAAEQFLNGRKSVRKKDMQILGAPVPALEREALRAYCRERLEAHVSESLPRLMAQCDVDACRWDLGCPDGKWGICRRGKKEVALNMALCWMPPEVVDECILHELNHFAFEDHAPAFWERMTQLMPSWPYQEGILRTLREGVRHVYPV